MLSIIKKSTQAINGETVSGIDAAGHGQLYDVSSKETIFSASIRYDIWNNGEREVVCLEASGDPRLNTTIGRLRIGIYSLNDSWDWATLNTAVLRTVQPPHATGKKLLAEVYADHLGFDLGSALNRYGNCKVGTKEVLLNTTGRSRNELCMVFEKNNQVIPVAAFALTRIVAIIKGGEILSTL